MLTNKILTKGSSALSSFSTAYQSRTNGTNININKFSAGTFNGNVILPNYEGAHIDNAGQYYGDPAIAIFDNNGEYQFSTHYMGFIGTADKGNRIIYVKESSIGSLFAVLGNYGNYHYCLHGLLELSDTLNVLSSSSISSGYFVAAKLTDDIFFTSRTSGTHPNVNSYSYIYTPNTVTPTEQLSVDRPDSANTFCFGATRLTNGNYLRVGCSSYNGTDEYGWACITNGSGTIVSTHELTTDDNYILDVIQDNQSTDLIMLTTINKNDNVQLVRFDENLNQIALGTAFDFGISQPTGSTGEQSLQQDSSGNLYILTKSYAMKTDSAFNILYDIDINHRDQAGGVISTVFQGLEIQSDDGILVTTGSIVSVDEMAQWSITSISSDASELLPTQPTLDRVEFVMNTRGNVTAKALAFGAIRNGFTMTASVPAFTTDRTSDKTTTEII